jgi:hypothetical protein
MGRCGRRRRTRDADGDRGFRTSGLNVMMSMKQEGKPVSFRRGLRGAAAAPRRLHRAAQRRSSPSTAPAAPCMRMPPRAACMCAPCSI